VRIGGKAFRTIWPGSDAASVQIIDQTRLPHEFEIISIKTASEAARAIKDMQVRGAPLIDVTAAYGLALAMRAGPSDANLDTACAVLAAARPTAVNLQWALAAMRRHLLGLASNRTRRGRLRPCRRDRRTRHRPLRSDRRTWDRAHSRR
jgi:methylthioribose-1-phosphate isomerase